MQETVRQTQHSSVFKITDDHFYFAFPAPNMYTGILNDIQYIYTYTFV